MRFEKGDDRIDQIPPPTHRIAEQMLRVIVVSPVREHASHTEEIDELVETRNALGALCNRELVRHLIASLVALPARSITLPNEADGEAALSVYKTYDPASLNQSFLLISCTRHIVTVPPA